MCCFLKKWLIRVTLPPQSSLLYKNEKKSCCEEKKSPLDMKLSVPCGLNSYIRAGDIKMYIVPVKNTSIPLLRYLIVTVWVKSMPLVQVDSLFPFRRLFYAL